MTGPEHYREAEDCLKAMNGKGKEACSVLLGQAQVHATLALAAANVNSDHWSEDYAAWDKVIGKSPGGES